MYTSPYFYRVPSEKVEQFLVIQRKSAEIYRENGAIDDWTFGPENLTDKYGIEFTCNLGTEFPSEKLFSDQSVGWDYFSLAQG